MNIRIEDLRNIDFSDVTTGDVLHPIHPGEILREEYLEPLGLSVNALATALRVPPTRLYEIVREKRAISPDTALRLAYYFGGDAQFWLNLQTTYDLRIEISKSLSAIEREVLPRETEAA